MIGSFLVEIRLGITEWLANLPIHIVVIAIVVLLAVRFALIKRQARAAKAVAEIAESLAVAMGLVFLIIRPFIVQAFFIPSASMRPTLLERDHIMVNKFIYRFREPARGDVVVFLAPPEAPHGGKQQRQQQNGTKCLAAEVDVPIAYGHARCSQQTGQGARQRPWQP